MTPEEIQTKFEAFFSKQYSTQIMSAAQESKPLVVDFVDLEKWDPVLADTLLESPISVFKEIDSAISNIDTGMEQKRLIVRFKNLPESSAVEVKNLRSKHIKKLISVKGIIKQASEVRPKITAATFECKSCGERITLLQESESITTPFVCSCGNRRSFDLVSRKLIDHQRIIVEECPESLIGSAQPRKLGVFLRDDLVDPNFQKKIVPGNKIVITGVLNDAPILTALKQESVKRDIYLDANHIETVEQEFEEIVLTDKDEVVIKELAQNPKVYELLIKSMAPSIYGYEDVKEAVALQLFGGVRKVRHDGITTRGDIHILLVGDPGAGKCIAGDAKIVLADGSVTTIGKSVNEVLGKEGLTGEGEYFKKTNHDLFSMNLDGKIEPMKATAVWKRKAHDALYRIKTYCGRSIVATAEHPFFISENALIMAKNAANLGKNDFIATPARLDVKGAIQKIDCKFERTPAKNGVHIKVPGIMNKEFARLLGYLIGDGHAYFTQSSAMISLTNNNEALLSDFSNLLSKLFGVNPTKRNSHKGKTAKEAYVCNIELGRLLKEIDESLFLRAKEKRVPSIVMKSPNSVLAEFIRSYFECEAYVDSKRRTIEVQSASKDFVEDVQIALLRFGIVSQINSGMKCATNTEKKIMRRYWRLSVSGEMADSFGKKVGFFSEEKRTRLEKMLQKKTKHNTNIHIIPGTSELLLTLRKLLKMSQKDFGISRSTYEHYDVGDRTPSKENLMAVVKAFEKRFVEIKDGLNNDENEFAYTKIKQLHLICEADIFWDKVIGVEKIKPENEWVYDLQVDGVHNFVANNIFVHNSQLLKYVMGLAPKARYIVGKSASGAGITATVVKDEFMRGWALEAGAIVLANNGIIGIDELDKMSPEDRSAMHEAMEQQCYHPNTEIILADGRSVKIGPFVDKLMEENKSKIYNGKDCEILPVDGIKIQTTDMKTISHTKINRVSRHKAPERMYKITYSNGRSICVTPEHPTFVYAGGNIIETRADKVSECMLAPAPQLFRTQPQEEIALAEPQRWHPNLKQMSFPKKLDKNLARFLGYFVSEGHSYKNAKNRYAEVGITNSDTYLIDEVNALWKGVFNIVPNVITQNSPLRHNNVPVQVLRCPSQIMYDFLSLNFPEIVAYSTSRVIPQKIRESSAEIQLEFLRTMFLGDGFVDSERFGYITSSYELAKGLQDILLNNSIWSYIAKDVRKKGTYYKVVVSKEGMQRFNEAIVSQSDKRIAKIRRLTERSGSRRNSTDIVPTELVQKLYSLLAEYRMLDGYFQQPKALKLLENPQDFHDFNRIIEKEQNSNRAVVKGYVEELEGKINQEILDEPKATRKLFAINVESIARCLNVSTSTIYNIEQNKTHSDYDKLHELVKKLACEKNEKARIELEKIKDFVFSDIRFVSVKSVEVIENHGLEWVYDVTVEPTRTFISEGLVLHNTVTVSKANVQATLSAKTTVLAAANPKLGRFNNFNPLASQIDLPETLLSRFDLIFAFRDIPDKQKDSTLVRHILKLHREPDVENSPIDAEILRKFIAYAKSNCSPVLTRGAETVIENFYVGLRSKYSGDTQESKSVPIGARQLEAIIRLSEASAKVRLSDKVLEEDAQRAINVVTAYLMKLGMDPETGKLDIDRLESGISANQRNKIRIILDLIESMQRDSEDKTVLIEDVLAAAEEQGIKDAMEIIQKMKREGELFEPKMGRIRKI